MSGRMRSAFTLVELLVVLAVVGLLVGLLLPAVQMVREGARRTECLNRVRQLGLGMLGHEAQRGSLPSGIAPVSARPYGSQTWLQAILPFVEQQAVADQAEADYQVLPSPFVGHAGMRTVIPLYQCPSDPDAGQPQWTHEFRLVALTSYLGVNGTDWEREDGVLFLNSALRLAEIPDGQSNTLLIGERPHSPDFWYGWWYAGHGQLGTGSGDMLLGVRERKAPAPAGLTTWLEDCPPGPYQYVAGRRGQQCDTLHFWSDHPGGAVFALCDGSVRFISYEANELLPALATRAGGEVAELPE